MQVHYCNELWAKYFMEGSQAAATPESASPDMGLIGRGLPVAVLFVCSFPSFMKSPRFDVLNQIRMMWGPS